jgi:hypothetical protein
LADHLAFAADRERQGGFTGATVWQRVLDRFGNPNAVARQLWWDAMKESIMRDWIKTAVITLVGAAMMVFMVIMFQQMQQSNQQLMLILDRAGQDTSTSINVFFHRGSKDGPPAQGIEVQFSGKIFGDEQIAVDAVTDREGRIHYGPVVQGNYTIDAHDPQSGLSYVRSVVLFAGQGADDLHIATPDVPMVDVSFDLGLPPYSDDRYLLAQMNLESSWVKDGAKWSAGHLVSVGTSGLTTEIGSPQAFSRPGPVRNRALRGQRSRMVDVMKATFDPGRSIELKPALRVAATELAVQEVYPVFVRDPLGGVRLTLVSRLDSGHALILNAAEARRIRSIAFPQQGLPTVVPEQGKENRFQISLPHETQSFLAVQARAWLNAKALNDYQTGLPIVLAEEFEEVVSETHRLGVSGSVLVDEDGTPVAPWETLGDDYVTFGSEPRGAINGKETQLAAIMTMHDTKPTVVDSDHARYLIASNLVGQASVNDPESDLMVFGIRSPIPSGHDTNLDIGQSPVARITADTLSEPHREAFAADISPAVQPSDRERPLTGFLLRWGPISAGQSNFIGLIPLDNKDPERQNLKPRFLVMRPPEKAATIQSLSGEVLSQAAQEK